MQDTKKNSLLELNSMISFVLGLFSWILAFLDTGIPGLIILLISAIAGMFLGIRGLDYSIEKSCCRVVSILGMILCVGCLIYASVIFCITYWIVHSI